jgi:hypothetical protein
MAFLIENLARNVAECEVVAVRSDPFATDNPAQTGTRRLAAVLHYPR